MANEFEYRDAANPGLTTFYLVPIVGDQMPRRTDGVLQTLSSANWRSSVIVLSDTGHAGIYLGNMPTGAPQKVYEWIVQQASGDPLATALMGDQEVSDEDEIDW